MLAHLGSNIVDLDLEQCDDLAHRLGHCREAVVLVYDAVAELPHGALDLGDVRKSAIGLLDQDIDVHIARRDGHKNVDLVPCWDTDIPECRHCEYPHVARVQRW